MLADTEPIRHRARRHAAGAAEPGDHRHHAFGEVVAGFLDAAHLGRELRFQGVDDRPQRFRVYPPFLAALKLADRRLQPLQICAPFPQHTHSLQTYVRFVNALNSVPMFAPGRRTGWWGILFVAMLLVVSGMLSLPTAAESGSRINAFYGAHRQLILIQQVIGALTVVPFLAFAMGLDRRARAGGR